MSRAKLAAGLIIAGGSLAGCRARPIACMSPEGCAPSQSCTAGRCVAPSSEVAPESARRIRVLPSEMAVVSSRGGSGGSLPPEIALGGAALGSIVVLLRFPTPWGNHVRVASAFLTLEPFEGSLPETQPVEVSVARVLEPWSRAEVSWGRLPRLSAPEARAFATASPPKTLRIDVSAIVQRWARGRMNEQGIALMTGPDASTGATFSTGIAGAPGPRLDVYLR
jgi:hypothetical protein